MEYKAATYYSAVYMLKDALESMRQRRQGEAPRCDHEDQHESPVKREISTRTTSSSTQKGKMRRHRLFPGRFSTSSSGTFSDEICRKKGSFPCSQVEGQEPAKVRKIDGFCEGRLSQRHTSEARLRGEAP